MPVDPNGHSDRSGPLMRPATWDEALRMRSEHPEAVAICGGTDLMVDINFGRARPDALLDLTAVAGLDSWQLIDGGAAVRIGAAVSFTQIIEELPMLCPALAMAARTVGSPQIRNRGTVAGNLATASPAGDAHPVLLACWAEVEAESVRGSRLIGIDDFFVGPKKSALAPDELIRAVRIPAATGPQQFAKVGPRNAMVIATASFALNLDPAGRRVGTGIGSAGPTPLRSAAAEQMLAEALAGRWDRPDRIDEATRRRFGELVAAAAVPIDDVRGSAAYRTHALGVLAPRCLGWALADLERRDAA